MAANMQSKLGATIYTAAQNAYDSVTGFINGSPAAIEAARGKTTEELRTELHRVLAPYPSSYDLEGMWMIKQMAIAALLVVSGDAGRVGAIKTVLNERNEQYVKIS